MASSPSATPSDATAGDGRHARPIPHDTQVDQLAQFVCGAQFEDISEPAREQLKLRVLDSLGCALGARRRAGANRRERRCGSLGARHWRR